MFAPQVASRPPSSRDSPQLRPQHSRSELEIGQTTGIPAPVFTPSLHRSLRKDHEDLHLRQRSTATFTPLAAATKEQEAPEERTPIFFRPRTSILDYTELMYQGSDRMRGLVTCFWTIVGAYLLSLLFSHYERSGEVMAGGLASVIFSRAADLILSDLALVASTAVVVPLVMLWVKVADPRRGRSAVVVQAAAEVSWLAFWYAWQGSRGWPWAQRCFFALHTVVNWMKVHSYLSTNRRLACTLRTVDELRADTSGDSKDAEALEAELCPYGTRFPSNVTLSNYAMFQLSPALVYELEYPRTAHIRWGYVAEKLAGTAGIFVVFYIVVAHLVIPHLERMPDTGVGIATLHLMGPMATCWLLFFFITFDSIANGFAELTRFADRRFYDDWWNARGLDEFSRKWNRPVHMFLARHVYMPVREAWPHPLPASSALARVRRAVPPSVAAMAATFFFSSILHELTIVVACHRWNYAVFFFSQMMQIPLIICSEKLPWFRNQQALRNWAFWLAMVSFQPFLLCFYTYPAFAKSTSLSVVSSSAAAAANMVAVNATSI
ncbi:Sterol O-acyltransferase 2 (Sterol-ester synthase 2) [Coemansia aciculifera]|nr:Sterol O-acyltransferase 2 (Sterol-ester synthase 2) [Coemansia aciculifera]